MISATTVTAESPMTESTKKLTAVERLRPNRLPRRSTYNMLNALTDDKPKLVREPRQHSVP
jgi:hypothetical protein